MASSDARPVRRRHVFFIAGFDPKSPRYYHALYRSQAKRQTAVSGMAIQIDKARSQPGPHSTAWAVEAQGASGPVHTVYELLQWDDIVRAHWSPSPWRVLIDGIRTVLFGLRDGAVQRMYRLYRPPVYATFFPLVLLLLCALLAAAVGLGVGSGLAATVALPRGLATGAGAAVALVLLWQALLLVHRVQFTWLLRLVRFTHLHAEGKVPGMDQRLAAFAERIAEVMATPPSEASDGGPDEVLVVGHSVGATLAMSVLARALERSPALGTQRAAQIPARPAFALLSLGQCIPLMSALSPAQALRGDLQTVANSPIPWLDISAPIDWAAFPGVDPVAGAGLPPAPPGWHPRLLSPRFHQLFGPETYARLKRNRFQVHLQYLMASERPGAFDYFAITAGPQTLSARFPESGPGSAGDQSPE